MAYQSILNPHPVSFTWAGLTDAQLRASAVAVSLASTTITGTVAATQSGTWNIGSITTLPALATGANVIGGVTQSGTWNIGSITTLPALVAGSAIIGKAGIDQTTPGTTNAVSLAQIGATTVLTGNGIAGAGAQRVTIASDNTAFPVNATLQTGANVIGALTANQSVNVAQMNGVAVTMGSGVTGTGVQRVVLATDVALPTGANVIGALTANQSVNNAQVAGVATATGNGVVGTGVQRVAIASDNSAIPVTTASVESSATFRGRVQTFRTPGRGGTAGQKIFALHNATGSTKIVHINQVTVDLVQTAVIAITTIPPIIRVYRFTALPTNGSALTKVKKDTNLTSNASITAWGDAGGDGAGSITTLTITPTDLLTQEFAPRFITGAGYEMFDRTEMLSGWDIVLRALEGIVVFLDYTVAAANPTTNSWVAGCDWYEV